MKFDYLKKNAFNILLLVAAVYILAPQIPARIDMFKREGTLAPQGVVTYLTTEQGVAIPLKQKQVLVFWATWCGPCKIELARIQKLIESGQLDPQSVLAVSVAEDREVVLSSVAEQKFTFPVALDSQGLVSKLYKVSGTPTILLIDEQGQVDWITMGLSPGLELRIKSFLKL